MADRDDRLRELFDQAVDLPPLERGEFFDRACGTNGPLRHELERLVGAYERLATVFSTERPDGDDLQTPDYLPRSIGAYRIVREIAHGGVGTVFLAVRNDDEYRKRVAVKVLREGLESRAIVRRFRHERQILASIDHPFIAKLLDGGSTRNGLPYLVMEYVEGQPVDAYCDSRCLTISERLDIFCKICEAVHFAHQNLIVHRDLKPGNVLVNADGMPKLVDFGIAKPLNPDMLSLTVDATSPDARPMTPQYASPEQVKGGPITTATDVYSLGVLLYELLTGHYPYRVRGQQIHEIAAAICDAEPTRPSTVVGLEEEETDRDGKRRRLTPEAVSRARGESPDRLRRELRGDLEKIVLMAMRKEPQRRYGSVEQLGDDIRRYQRGFPVRARKSTFAYRSTRFVRRHAIGVALALIAVLSLAGFGALAVVERRRAEREAERAKGVVEFLTDTLASIDPRVAQGTEPTVRDLLQEAERQLDRAHHLPPAEVAAVRLVVAESRFQLGHLAQARDQYSRVLAGGPGTNDAGADLEAALVGLAASQRELGLLREAEQNARLAVNRAGESAAASRTMIRAQDTFARVLLQLGGADRIAEAESVVDRAVSLAAAALKTDDVDRQRTDLLVAQLRMAQGRVLEAEPIARRSYDRALSTLGPRHPHTFETVHVFADCLLALNRYTELLAVQHAHAGQTERVLGADHPVTIRVHHTVAETLRQLDRLQEAKAMYEQVLTHEVRALGSTHRMTLSTRHNLALLFKDLKDPKRAEQLLRDIARVRQEQFGPHDADTLQTEMMIALTMFEQGRLDDSRQAYAAVLPRIKEGLGENAKMYLVGLVNYAGLLYRLGDYPMAEQTLREGLDAHRRVFGDHYFGTYYTMMELGTTVAHLARYDEAETLLLKALTGVQAIFRDKPGHQRIRQALDRLAKLYVAWGKPDKAAEYSHLLKQAEVTAKSTPRGGL